MKMEMSLESLIALRNAPARRVAAAVCRMATPLLDRAGTLTEDIRFDHYEKILLLSAAILDFNPDKDMRSNYMLAYVGQMQRYVHSCLSVDELWQLFIAQSSGCRFEYELNPNESNRAEIYNLVRSYILDRIILYRKLIKEFYDGQGDSLGELMFVAGTQSFAFSHFSCRVRNQNWLPTPPPTILNRREGYVAVLTILKSVCLDLVDVPEHTWMTATPQSPGFHTEMMLPFLDLPPHGRYLTLRDCPPRATLCCRNCAKRFDVTSVAAGSGGGWSVGRQCPQCGEFVVEHFTDKSQLRLAAEAVDCMCGNNYCTGYVLRRRDESIFKGMRNPLFCPRCYSVDLYIEK